MNSSPGHFLIVSRDRPDLLERALTRFAANERVEVIFDRRGGDRRRGRRFTVADRRRGERRRVPEGTEDLRVHPVVVIAKRGASAVAPLPEGPLRASQLTGPRPALVEPAWGVDEAEARLEQSRRDTEWVFSQLVPGLMASVRECEQLRRDNEAMRRERADLEAQLAATLARVSDILRRVPADLRPPGSPAAPRRR